MRRKRVLLLTGIGLIIILSIDCVWCIRPQPRYKGKTVFQLSRLVSYSSLERRLMRIPDEEALDALNGLRLLGPRGEKILIRQLQTRETKWMRTYKTIWLRLPPLAQSHLPPYDEATYRRHTAVTAIGKLGTLSAQTERALIHACYQPDDIVRVPATLILGYRGSRSPETLQAVRDAMGDPQVARVVNQSPELGAFDFKPKTVEQMMFDLSCPFREARYQAASALQKLGPKAQPAIPALITACENTDDLVRVSCVKALGNIGVAASNAIPTLQKLLTADSSFARSAAAEAIQQIQSPVRRGNPD